MHLSLLAAHVLSFHHSLFPYSETTKMRLGLITILVSITGALAAPLTPRQDISAVSGWPDAVQGNVGSPLPESFLRSALVQDALKKVQASVPASVLNIKQSIFRPEAVNAPTYTDNPEATMYWPHGLGYRPEDVHKCPQYNDYGISFDDGPSPFTKEVRQGLDKIGAKATFFVMGGAAKAHPDEISATYAAGHEIGIHTWNHLPLTSLSNEHIIAELLYTQAYVESVIGVKPVFFRPPFGDVDDRVRGIASALGLTNVMWTSRPDRDTHDASKPDQPAQVLAAVTKFLSTPQPGFISLQHDLIKPTVDMATQIFDHIKAKQDDGSFALKPVALGQCLARSPYAATDAHEDGPEDLPQDVPKEVKPKRKCHGRKTA